MPDWDDLVSHVGHIHVYPRNDAVGHDTDNFDECICGPDVEFIDGGAVITHHSLDGREQHEPKEPDHA